MSEKVVTIHGATLQGQPVATLVAELERIIADAKRGEIRAIAFAVVISNGQIGTFWDHDEVHKHHLSSAIFRLCARYQDSYSGPGTPVPPSTDTPA